MYCNPVAVTGAAAQVACPPDLVVGARRDIGGEFCIVLPVGRSGSVAT